MTTRDKVILVFWQTCQNNIKNQFWWFAELTSLYLLIVVLVVFYNNCVHDLTKTEKNPFWKFGTACLCPAVAKNLVVSLSYIIFLPHIMTHLMDVETFKKQKHRLFSKSEKQRFCCPDGVFIVFAWQGCNLTLGRCRNTRNMGLGACSYRTYNLESSESLKDSQSC